MILICLAINPVGDCSEMTVLGFRSSLLVIITIKNTYILNPLIHSMNVHIRAEMGVEI